MLIKGKRRIRHRKLSCCYRVQKAGNQHDPILTVVLFTGLQIIRGYFPHLKEIYGTSLLKNSLITGL